MKLSSFFHNRTTEKKTAGYPKSLAAREGESLNRAFMRFLRIYMPDRYEEQNAEDESALYGAEYNLRIIPMVSAILGVFDFVWFLAEWIFNGLHGTEGFWMALILGTEFLCSVGMFCLPKTTICRNFRVVNWLFFAYYLVIDCTVLCLSSRMNMAAATAGTDLMRMAISVSECLLFVPAFFPILDKTLSMVYAGITVVLALVPYLFPGGEMYHLHPRLLLLASVLLGYRIMYSTNMRLAEKESQGRKLRLEMAETALRDALTGVMSRHALNMHWEKLSNNPKTESIGVLMLDVDNFKAYNDKYSHKEGDTILRSICANVADAFGEENFLFRFGGEEFIMFLPDAKESDLLLAGQKIRRAVWNADIASGEVGQYGRVTVTVGCALIYRGNLDQADYITLVDEQLYIGKSRGKNCVVLGGKAYRDEEGEVSLQQEKYTVVVAEDNEMNREILTDILVEENYDVLEAADGKEALELISGNPSKISALLLDLNMPVVDGFGVLKEMRRQNWDDRIPVLIITGDTKSETVRRCYDYTISDFIPKPFDELLIKLRLRNALERTKNMDALRLLVEDQMLELRNNNERLQQITANITDMLGNVTEARDADSGEHVKRVRTYTHLIAESIYENHPESGLTLHAVDMITLASPLHDVGKVAIPDRILLSPNRLTKEEFEIMKTHTLRGCEILEENRSNWDDEYYRYCYDICRYHHEKYDGRGYPDGLKGDEIPISAQVVALADCFDALVNARPYKAAFTPEKARDMILGGECGAFSPLMMDTFNRCFPEMKKLVASGKVNPAE